MWNADLIQFTVQFYYTMTLSCHSINELVKLQWMNGASVLFLTHIQHCVSFIHAPTFFLFLSHSLLCRRFWLRPCGGPGLFGFGPPGLAHSLGVAVVFRRVWPRRVWHLVVLLPLHPAVLKPDFDLSLWEAEGMGYLDPPPAGQVAVEVELLLQLQGLVPGIGLSPTLTTWVCGKQDKTHELCLAFVLFYQCYIMQNKLWNKVVSNDNKNIESR